MLAVNLRGDLAKLSDAELAERLEAAWRTYEAANSRTWWPPWRVAAFRGPIRHPRAYRFAAILQGASGHLLFDLVLAWLLSSKCFESWIYRDPHEAKSLSLCEIQDMTDEMERRLKHRKGSAQ